MFAVDCLGDFRELWASNLRNQHYHLNGREAIFVLRRIRGCVATDGRDSAMLRTIFCSESCMEA